MNKANSLKTFLLLFLLGLSVRVLYYVFFSNELIIGNDAYDYIKLSQQFANGNFSEMLHPYWSPFYPFLLGLASIFTDSNIIPAITVSIILGSFAVPLTYFLVKQSYGNHEAIIAAVMSAFYPHLLSSVFEVGTTNVYLILIISALIIGWNAVKLNSTLRFFIIGILIGLAYLTRPEAIGYIFFFLAVIIYHNFRQSSLSTKNTAQQLVVCLLGFIIFAAPYLYYLKQETGRWTISAKVNNNLFAGNYGETSLNDLPKESPVNRSVGNDFKVIFKAFFTNFHRFHKMLPYIFPPILLMLIGLGLFRQIWDKERLKRELYILSFALLTIFGYLVSVVEVPYFYVLLPIFIGWTARGIVEFINWFGETATNFLPSDKFYLFNKTALIIVTIILLNLYVLPLNAFMRPTESAWQFSRYELRDAGLFLQENGISKPAVMAVDFRSAFYAKGEFIQLKSSNLNEILKQAEETKVDYIVFDERNLKESQELHSLIEGTQTIGGFQLVYHANPQKGYKVSIYQALK